MVKLIVLLFVCFALAAFATAKPSHEESPKPETNNIVEERSKRSSGDDYRQICSSNCNSESNKINSVTINSGDSYGQVYCLGNGSNNINTFTVNSDDGDTHIYCLGNGSNNINTVTDNTGSSNRQIYCIGYGSNNINNINVQNEC